MANHFTLRQSFVGRNLRPHGPVDLLCFASNVLRREKERMFLEHCRQRNNDNVIITRLLRVPDIIDRALEKAGRWEEEKQALLYFALLWDTGLCERERKANKPLLPDGPFRILLKRKREEEKTHQKKVRTFAQAIFAPYVPWWWCFTSSDGTCDVYGAVWAPVKVSRKEM